MNIALIGHRGEPESYPENSLAGYRAILAAGARYIETDVQLTADGIPVLSHDSSLLRITGHDCEITATRYADIRELPAGYPSRFGVRFTDLRINRLDEFAALLAGYPSVTAFIELKDASLMSHGAAHVVDRVLEMLDAVLPQCVIISFAHSALLHTREVTTLPVGWVLPEWSAHNQRRARILAPEYLLCNRKRLPPPGEPLWEGPWRWVIYTVDRAREVLECGERGIDMVETNVIRKLLLDPQLTGTGCD
jgi:glycerophosphoryl diester phosphodiesterase